MYLYYTNNKYIMYYMYHVYIMDFIKIENIEKGNKNKATSSKSRQKYFDQFFFCFHSCIVNTVHGSGLCT